MQTYRCHATLAVPVPCQHAVNMELPVITIEDEYEAERIAEERGPKGKKQYVVYWVGYEEPTWEPYDAVKDTAALRQFFARRNPIGLSADTASDDDEFSIFPETLASIPANTEEPQTIKQTPTNMCAQSKSNSTITRRMRHGETQFLVQKAVTRRFRWVFKKKLNRRLCSKGFTQRQGIDYDEIFSPVVHELERSSSPFTSMLCSYSEKIKPI
ncbi:hypothetical protein BDZ88DRAFT_270376 [Geranomyces variabilis]|nr:hypothetical protein BDZ88DRAFT_270376 [Geranomyces variabilis]